jgi:DNA primase
MSFEDFDVRAYLKHIGIPFWEEGNKNVGRGWIGLQCLFCADSHNHLGVSLSFKNYSCWKCGTTGSLLSLITELEGISYGAALDRIDDFQSILPIEPEVQERLQGNHNDILPYGCLEKLTAGQRGYLSKRRFDPDRLVELWDLRAGPITGPWSYRIIIPVRLRNRIVTWVGMDTAGVHAAKYKAAPTRESYVPTGELVYGADHTGKNVLVVEGATDVWRMGPGTVGLLGMGTTEYKVDQLLALGAERYFIMLDGEPLAVRNAHKIAKDLVRGGKEAEVIELAEGDPADMSDEDAYTFRTELDIGA